MAVRATDYAAAEHLDDLAHLAACLKADPQDANPRIQDQAGRLQAAADQMDAAFARRAKALVAEAASFGQLQVEKLATIETCRRVGHRLTKLYPYQRGRVRSHFRRIHRRPRPRLQRTIPWEMRSTTNCAGPDDFSLGSDVRGNPTTSPALGSAGWDDVFPGRPAVSPAGEKWGFRERPPFPSG